MWTVSGLAEAGMGLKKKLGKMLDDPTWQEKEELLLHTSLRDNIPPRAAILASQHALG